MRQYVWVAPWWPSLSCTSTSTVYIQAFGMTGAKNFWFESVTCLCSNPLMCRKRSASCFGAFPFNRHLEICLQNGSVLCICSRECSLSSVSGFSVATGVSLTVIIRGGGSSVMLHCTVLLLVLNVGPSWLVAVSIWTVACLSCGSSTSLERQSAGFVLGSSYPLKGNVICC